MELFLLAFALFLLIPCAYTLGLQRGEKKYNNTGVWKHISINITNGMIYIFHDGGEFHKEPVGNFGYDFWGQNIQNQSICSGSFKYDGNYTAPTEN